MSADNVTERARRIVSGAMFGLTTPMMVDAIVSDLDAAGLLASPEHDRKVAAHTFRWAADQMEPAGPPLPGAMRHGWSAAVKTLRDLADESDRKAGERDE